MARQILHSNAKRNRQRGKSSQKAIADIFQFDDALNVGILGKEDVITKRFQIEVKSRKRFVGDKFLQQVEQYRKKDKIPIAIVHILNRKHDNDIVLIRLKDFLNLIQGIVWEG